MITCRYMEKSQKDKWLPALFALYHENMQLIEPSPIPYEVECSRWLAEVSPALDKAPRKIILCLEDDALLGYIQYYTRGQLLMIEEIQIVPDYQNTLLFHRMCRFLCRNLPREIKHIEAYADIRNTHSRSLMSRLGFSQTTENSCSGFVHLRANASDVIQQVIIST